MVLFSFLTRNCIFHRPVDKNSLVNSSQLPLGTCTAYLNIQHIADSRRENTFLSRNQLFTRLIHWSLCSTVSYSGLVVVQQAGLLWCIPLSDPTLALDGDIYLSLVYVRRGRGINTTWEYTGGPEKIEFRGKLVGYCHGGLRSYDGEWGILFWGHR